MIDVAIIGASGYTGLELVKILIGHPEFNITYVATSEGETSLTQLHPALTDVYDMPVAKADAHEIAEAAQLAFLALPHKASMGFAKQLLEQGVKVVDLSADYRLELETYEAHYCPHEDKVHLPQAVYGLPEFYKEALGKANLVDNPGCYPTATLLGLLPFVDHIDETFPIFIDAKSGVSGAGKKCTQNTHFISINENSFPYNPLVHRHQPEIAEKLHAACGKRFDVNFVPHLLPLTRGEMVDSYMLLKTPVDPLKILRNFYADAPFVRIFDRPVDIKSPSGTNFCDIYAKCVDQKLYINSAIDNLLRGASSQAVVNANLMCGFDEGLGIPVIAYVP